MTEIIRNIWTFQVVKLIANFWKRTPSVTSESPTYCKLGGKTEKVQTATLLPSSHQVPLLFFSFRSFFSPPFLFFFFFFLFCSRRNEKTLHCLTRVTVTERRARRGKPRARALWVSAWTRWGGGETKTAGNTWRARAPLFLTVLSTAPDFL